MKRGNLFDATCADLDFPQACVIHDSPELKIINFTFAPGQSFLVYSDEMQGKVSLVVIEGQGEFVGEEANKTSIRTGDVFVSELNEPQSLTAATALRLLVTISPPSGLLGDAAA